MRSIQTATVTLGIVLVGLLVLPALPGCKRAVSLPHVRTFVGYVENSDAFIALSQVDGEVMAYVCNGRDLATWLRGPAGDDGLDLSAGEARLQATFDGAGFVGTFTSAHGGSHAFRARPATQGSGFYRAVQTVAGLGYVGGWIVLSDGQQRGAVKADSLLVEGTLPPLDPERPTVALPGGGALTARPVEDLLSTPPTASVTAP